LDQAHSEQLRIAEEYVATPRFMSLPSINVTDITPFPTADLVRTWLPIARCASPLPSSSDKPVTFSLCTTLSTVGPAVPEVTTATTLTAVTTSTTGLQPSKSLPANLRKEHDVRLEQARAWFPNEEKDQDRFERFASRFQIEGYGDPGADEFWDWGGWIDENPAWKKRVRVMGQWYG
jgi:hypothetical protein